MNSSPICRARVLACALSSAAALAVSPPATAQWTDDAAANTTIVSASGEQVLPKIGVRADGGCYVGWFDSSAGSYQVRLQRLDPQGVQLWDAAGLIVSAHPQSSSLVDWDLITDSAGNCVLTFTDTRDGGDLDVFAYRISPSGAFLWGPNGVQCSVNSDFDPSPRICEASDGDFVVVWGRLPDSGGGDIRMQRITPDGSPRFAAGGIAIAGLAGERPGFAKVIPATAGDVVVCWIRNIAQFTSPRHLWAQKYSPTGVPLWGSPAPTPLIVYSAVSLPIAYWPELLPDSAGGAVLAWHRSQANQNNCLVQRVDSSGNILFPAGGVLVSTDTIRNRYSPSVSFHPASGDTFVFWDERNGAQSNWGVFGQKLSAAGIRQWGAEGRIYEPVDALLEGRLRSVPTADGAIAFWFAGDPGDPAGLRNAIRATRVDGNGDPLWSPDRLDVSSLYSEKDDPEVTLTPTGDAIVVWQDNRNGPGDVYGQRVNADGTLGNPACPGDLDGDGTVGLGDLTILLSNFGTLSGATAADGDLDGDGDVELADLTEFLSRFGLPCP